MRVNLIIPRHKHGSMKDGKRKYLYLSAEAVAALDKLTTCSESSSIDLAIRLLDVLTSGNDKQLEAIGQELASATVGNDGLVWLARGLTLIAEELEAAVVLPPPWDA